MNQRPIASSLGIYLFAAGAIALGLIGLGWGDFATDWQRVVPTVPFRPLLAYATAIFELAAGIALCWGPSARAGALLLTAIFSVFALLWVPRIAGNPRIYDSWGNLFEELSAVIAGLVLCAQLARRDSAFARSEPLVARLYGICVISFGVVHLVGFAGLPAWIPAWIPPGPLFWAYATTVGFFLAAPAILFGLLAPLAARLLAVMILSFEVFVWFPKLFAAPHEHFIWSGNGIALALAGAAWVVADSIAKTAKHRQAATVPAPEIAKSA